MGSGWSFVIIFGNKIRIYRKEVWMMGFNVGDLIFLNIFDINFRGYRIKRKSGLREEGWYLGDR